MLRLFLAFILAVVPLPAIAQVHPRSSTEVRRELAAALEKGDRIALTRATLDLAQMGGSLSKASLDRVVPNLDPDLLVAAEWLLGAPTPSAQIERLRLQFDANANPGYDLHDHALFAEVPAEYRLVEGIAWDKARKRLFVGTVVEGRLAYMDKARVWHEVPIGSPRGGLFGMTIDARRNLLWIATGSVEQTAVAGERMSGLIAVDLRTLAVKRRLPLPEGSPGPAGDVALAADGTVYVSNPQSGAIHRCRPGCAQLDELVPAGTFRSPQGMLVARGGGRLLVADYTSGISTIDLATRHVAPFPIAGPAMLDGIDGIVGADRGFFVIQNGTRPRRVMWIPLVRGRVPTLERAITFVDGAGEATLGTRFGRNTMLFIADGQWERYGPGGKPADGGPPRPTPIERTEPPIHVMGNP